MLSYLIPAISYEIAVYSLDPPSDSHRLRTGSCKVVRHHHVISGDDLENPSLLLPMFIFSTSHEQEPTLSYVQDKVSLFFDI